MHAGLVRLPMWCAVFFFFNDTATPEIYTLSLHDALPICVRARTDHRDRRQGGGGGGAAGDRSGESGTTSTASRSEEHTSELQSRLHLVCRLLLEKKKKRSSSRRITATPRRRSRLCGE